MTGINRFSVPGKTKRSLSSSESLLLNYINDNKKKYNTLKKDNFCCMFLSKIIVRIFV